MDGNSRWAHRERRPRREGHWAGVDALRILVDGVLALEHVSTLTVCAPPATTTHPLRTAAPAAPPATREHPASAVRAHPLAFAAADAMSIENLVRRPAAEVEWLIALIDRVVADEVAAHALATSPIPNPSPNHQPQH